ncbi:MAG TPA: myxosortase-dependent M36 family metallopeptidase [Archangium sp.]|uniref:myxosortase-dependent M36 family metallopeptidase n=1 Tax=Archangium sp. TaxID=1872627 RepID=UPI002E34700F|nr:myxosortase-dependent M36 family metallopeptidase [Archangium sp.]HEX5752697.1 myxosortase-dependent M36 family metallopeptidase [Archangium sp.]
MRRLVATLSGLALVLSGTGAAARSLPNYDALQDVKPTGPSFRPVEEPGARVAHQDERTGSPTFLWVNKGSPPARLMAPFARMAPGEAALAQLSEHASLYGLSSLESAGARVQSVSQNEQGVKVVTIAQEAAGIEVFRQSLRLLLNRSNDLVAVSGTLSKHVSADVPASRVRFQLTASEVIALAYQDLTGHALDKSLLAPVDTKLETGRYSHYEPVSYARPLTEQFLLPARAKQVLYSLPGGLVPAYYVELNTGRADSKESDYYAYVVSAADGRLLLRNNLTADAEYSYRVFADATPPYTPHDGPSGTQATPHPTGTPSGFFPAFVPPSLVTLRNAPFSQNDPWLPDGATETTGNNVDAYADLVAPDNYNAGDLRPSVTAPGVFDRTMRFDIEPNADAEQIAAATTSLFFLNNWLHDWFYDSGFDEASGNAQTDNYGRGGLGGDAIRAQAQDYSGLNNANMSTPADGRSPRMQMYRFSGRDARVTVNAPESIARDFAAGIAGGFGPQSFDTTGDVVGAQDGVATSTDACTALSNAAEVAGKIALIDRGNCDFTVKMTNAQNAGAIGVILVDNVDGLRSNMGGTSTTITIPSLRLTMAEGKVLREATGVNVRLYRAAAPYLDGTVDNIIVAHEWGHYISNRLIGNAAGLVNNQGRAMGEGWGDFTALLMVTRAEDALVASNANWNGAYAAAEFATRGSSPDSAFFGIRRVTYSADMARNALMFRHISDGVALPTSAPISPGGVNSQVHNSGEVWATMLWECYVSLLRAHPFEEAQRRMKSYLVNGFKMTPVAPTYLEARDAIIAAANANDPADGERFWAAFARRGAGVGAVAPDRYSTNHAGVVESFSVGTNLELVSAVFADDLATGSCDKDGVLDNGETGRIIVTVRNSGSKEASNTSVTVFSPSAGVTVGNGGSMRFPVIPVGGQAEVSVPVTLRGATKGQVVNFSLAFRDEAQAIPGDKVHAFGLETQYDEAPATTATETVEGRTLPWGFESDTTLTPGSFQVVEFIADLNRAFFGPNLGAPGDIRLVTPPLEVSATEPLVLSFRHAYDLEFDATGYYDGAVIELSSDGGATWVDIGDSLYTGTIINTTTGKNPLKGRRGFVGTSAGFPTLAPATLDLGTAYAGQTVQIRFRIGSDDAAARTGWLLDDLAFTGIIGTPFTSIVGEDGVCMNRPPVANAGTDLTANERSRVTLSGSASDVDGDSVSYSWAQVSGPAVTLTGEDTATPSFTAPEVTGDSDVVLRLTVSDGTLTASDTVTVRVLNVNRAPTVNAGLDGSASERGGYTLSGSASDADGDTLSFLWTQVSGTPVALSNYDKASATFATPEVAFDEVLTFRLTVSDGQSSVSDTVDVAIHDVNRAPVVTASSVTVDERSTATLEATASDADGDTLSYSWTQLTGTAVTLSGANTARATFSTGEVSADSVLTFRVTVSDGRATATQDVVVNVRQVNRAPAVNAGVDGSVNERESYTLSGSASDPDGDTLSYSWVQVSGTPVALSGATSASATFTAPDTASGETLTFRLTVSDGKVTSSDMVSVTVNDVNRAPVVTASSVTVDERSTATLEATASDADGDTLSYSWTQVSGTAVTLSGANTARATFSTGEVSADSVLTFRVTVSDGRGATATQDVVVNVRQVNRAPTVNAGVDGVVNERASYTLSGSASDEDGDTLSYSWVQVSGTPVALSGATSARATFTAPETVSGETLSFRLTVSDGQSSASDTVNVVVDTVNRAPVVTVPAVTVDELSTATLEAIASDADGDRLTYSWTQLTGTPVVLSGADTARVTFSAGEVSADSVLTFRVEVFDGFTTASSDVAVTVRNVTVNRAPTVNAGVDGTANERSVYTLSGSASDVDGDALSYAWVQVSGTPVALTGASTASASFIAPETASGETLSFMLTVSDGKLSASDTVDVVVNDVNRAPVVTASPVTVDERSTASLVAIASDPDGDALTYAWTQLTGPSVTLSGANTATATFATGEVPSDRVLTFRVTVSDGKASATRDVSVTVRNVNRAPVARAGTALSAVSNATVNLDGSTSADADGGTLTYQWTQVGGPWVTLAGADTATPSFTAPAVRSNTDLVFRLVVRDGSLSSEPSTVTVTVSPADNQAPVARARILLSGSQESMTLDGSASSDGEGDALTYRWEQINGPSVQFSNANQAVLNVDVPATGTYSFRLTVTDARGASHNATVEATATLSTSTPEPGGCSSTGTGAPASVLGLALLGLLRRRRWLN